MVIRIKAPLILLLDLGFEKKSRDQMEGKVHWKGLFEDQREDIEDSFGTGFTEMENRTGQSCDVRMIYEGL